MACTAAVNSVAAASPWKRQKASVKGLIERGGLGYGHIEDQMNPQGSLGLDGDTSSAETVPPSLYPRAPSAPYFATSPKFDLENKQN
jgi:hypothetical protein